MSAGVTATVAAVTAADFGSFVEYLNDHLSDNGAGGLYFQPLQRDASRVPPEKSAAFLAGLEIPVGSPGWRRVWVARSAERQIIGHVDLRAHPERFAEHRCLLGMGVHRRHRAQGLGAALLLHAEQWASGTAGLEWIDLHVLSGNEAAVRLYLRTGFTRVGEIPEMFRIDGRNLAYTSMTKRVAKGGSSLRT
jgi:ribosomal protein S18 acetylase RimI-like enzyme